MAKQRTPDEILALDQHPERAPWPVYPGNLQLGKSVEPPGGPERNDQRPRRNRPVVRRKISPFNIMIMLIAAAIVIVLYISNIIAVNQLLHDVNALENEHRQVLMEQEILRARINRLASLERIQDKARELGLQNLREPPVWLSIDPERLKALEGETGKDD